MFHSDKLEVIEDELGLSIQLRWFSLQAYFLAFFSVFWLGFLGVWYTLAGASGAPLIAFLFPLLHVAAGVSMAYYTLCLFLNKTYIDVNQEHLWIHHTPIPWWKGNADIGVQEIQQVFVKEKKSKNKNGTSYTYELVAKLNNGTTRALLDIGIANSQQALVLEELIENYLGIKDQPVKGAYGKVRTTMPQRKSLPQPGNSTDRLELERRGTLDINQPLKEKLPTWEDDDLV